MAGKGARGHQGGSWGVPKPCGEGHGQLSPPASSQHPRQHRTLLALVSPGRLGGEGGGGGGCPGPFPRHGQRPGNKSWWDGEASPGRGICLAWGEVEGGEETAFQSVSPFVNPSKPPQCSPDWLQLQRGPLREDTGSPPASPVPSLRVSGREK